MTVQSLDGALSFVLRHVDETEAAWLAGFAIIDEFDRLHLAVTLEEGADVLLGGVEGEVPHIDRRHPIISLNADSGEPHESVACTAWSYSRQVKASRHTIGSFSQCGRLGPAACTCVRAPAALRAEEEETSTNTQKTLDGAETNAAKMLLPASAGSKQTVKADFPDRSRQPPGPHLPVPGPLTPRDDLAGGRMRHNRAGAPLPCLRRHRCDRRVWGQDPAPRARARRPVPQARRHPARYSLRDGRQSPDRRGGGGLDRLRGAAFGAAADRRSRFSRDGRLDSPPGAPRGGGRPGAPAVRRVRHDAHRVLPGRDGGQDADRDRDPCRAL